jgi:hypothetical protein
MMKRTAPIALLIAAAAFLAPPIRGDAPAIPSANFSASRYEALWTNSPFAVATSEDTGESSPDYLMVGIANIDGVSYASVIERQTQEHFLISTDKANRGMTLSTINHNQDGSETYANVTKDGQTLTLKLEQPAPAAPGSVPDGSTINMPGIVTPVLRAPGTGGGAFGGPGSFRPFSRIHRPTIHLPPSPAAQTPPLTPPPPPPQAQH